MVEHMANHIFRTVLMYFMVFGVMRIMGKREIGELSIFDLVISVMIAEIAVFALEDIDRPIYDGIVPMLTLLLIQIAIAMLSLRFRRVRLWFDGKPSVIIRNGQINRKEMRRQRYNLDDLLMQLRSQKVDSVADVEFAVLETSGQLSVVPKDKSEQGKGGQQAPKREASLSAKIKFEALPLPLIMDGKVNDENLKQIGKTRFWLKNQIQSKGLTDFKQVFFCSIDHKGKLYINAMDEK
ncbi:DUF421 domain-containing protein [Paenibacillus sp. DXFW5]|jgi:uncharacterized membrane protein YcaP (DUF421 family)|uniref:DUF421 domain-containing protein n=1 Tax=Paenibacillus rhizolycopersici TaxID=2780073 RepID=A0ABS2HFE7_9BACL|nr:MULTISPECIES: DUF421 domain-containing protein [Paenibacillus]MBM6998273.1 DUF421 domain-containing protein [Paenibacillus rhizolycopersici]GIP50479.1 UPF0702 transmembrane protein YrbG [Paenibacillus sp. J53TS2]